MRNQAATSLLLVSGVVAGTIDDRHQSGLFASSSSIIARKVHKCHNPPPPTVYFPLNFRYGSSEKITTDLVIPGSNKTMPVCLDQGSETFWVLQRGAVYNWGSERLATPGPCNISAAPVYEYSASPYSTQPAPFEYFNAYGGFSKIVLGNATVDDTMIFTSVAGQRSTIPHIRSALVNFISVRLPDPSGQCEVPDDLTYDVGILGTAPYQKNPDGTIKAAVQSMWMDKPPEGIKDTYTGGAIFGGIDTSKFIGPLVKVQTIKDNDMVGYYVAPPAFSFQGKRIKTARTEASSCFIDSGTRNDALPVSYDDQEAFYKTTGLVESPTGQISWPGSCETVPSNVTLDMRFSGKENGTFVDIKVPLKNYVRWDSGEVGLCRLNLYLGGCTLAAPFSTAAFFAADDERGEVAFAQGGISQRGSGPTDGSIALRIP